MSFLLRDSFKCKFYYSKQISSYAWPVQWSDHVTSWDAMNWEVNNQLNNVHHVGVKFHATMIYINIYGYEIKRRQHDYWNKETNKCHTTAELLPFVFKLYFFLWY